jgi:hypothetical protein
LDGADNGYEFFYGLYLVTTHPPPPRRGGIPFSEFLGIAYFHVVYKQHTGCKMSYHSHVSDDFLNRPCL